LGLAAAASRTTNPALLLLIVAVAAYVVASRRPAAPWARSFGFFLRLGLLVIAVRVAFQIVLGAPIGVTVVVPLPAVPLPDWLAGVRLGGPVTLEGLLYAAYEGLRLATILACVGAANSLASPTRLLKSVPAALYHVGVSIVVALTFTPQLVTDVDRVRTARRLRGRADSGLRGVAGAAMPVLEGGLDRAVTLAAAMDSRGYGRTAQVPAGVRRTAAALLLGGLLGAALGAYALLDDSAPGALGLPLLVGGAVAGVAGLWLAGRRGTRTRYRPDPWALPEWLVAGSGVAAAAAMVAVGLSGVPGLETAVDPPAWPALPPLAVMGILLALLPSVVAPPVPGTADRRPAAGGGS
jgi:energy-coupling factor transport system permease protein